MQTVGTTRVRHLSAKVSSDFSGRTQFAPTNSMQKFVILNERKNLTQHSVNYTIGRAGACSRRFYLHGIQMRRGELRSPAGAQCAPLRVVQICHSERSEESPFVRVSSDGDPSLSRRMTARAESIRPYGLRFTVWFIQIFTLARAIRESPLRGLCITVGVC